jgi:pimeloyl-ACP methyl ester carboxylesterase
MAFVERDGVKLAYESSGRGDPGIVFVHGWSCDRSYFEPQFAHFAERHAVVSVDLRGHGDSDGPENGYDIATFAADVSGVAAVAGLDRPVAIGHSMGGLVALAMASTGMARAAVMVDPAPILMSDATRNYFGKAAVTFAADEDGSARTEFVKGMFLPSDRVRRDEITSAMPRTPPSVAGACIHGIVDFDGAAALAACEVPLLSIGSASPGNSADALRKACPTITIGQTVGAGHFNQLEAPDQVNAMIRRFLEVNAL